LRRPSRLPAMLCTFIDPAPSSPSFLYLGGLTVFVDLRIFKAFSNFLLVGLSQSLPLQGTFLLSLLRAPQNCRGILSKARTQNSVMISSAPSPSYFHFPPNAVSQSPRRGAFSRMIALGIGTLPCYFPTTIGSLSLATFPKPVMILTGPCLAFHRKLQRSGNTQAVRFRIELETEYPSANSTMRRTAFADPSPFFTVCPNCTVEQTMFKHKRYTRRPGYSSLLSPSVFVFCEKIMEI